MDISGMRLGKLGFLLFLPLLILVFSLVFSPAAASTDEEQEGDLIFILDASGSMWGQVEGRTKIEIAKEALTGIIKDLPDELDLGLVAYGHRRKGDCNDVEELARLGTAGKNELIEKINAINPKGKTPITLSIRKTAEKLKTSEKAATIILVSDGKETCEGDPCALTKALRESGVKFVMHVIGFDVTEEERGQLECIADSGGGMYFAAKNAREFRMAAKKAVEKPPEKPEKQVFNLMVKAVKKNKIFNARVHVFKAGEKEPVASSWTHEESAEFNLQPGVYDIMVEDREVVSVPAVRFKGVTIKSGESVKKIATFTEGTVKITAVKNGKAFNARVHAFAAGEKTPVTASWTHEKAATFRLLPGTYDVVIEDKEVATIPTKKLTGIEVKSEQTIEKTVEFVEGLLKVTAIKAGKVFNARVHVLPAGGKKDVAASWTHEKTATFRLLPGTYDIRARDPSDDSTREKKGVSVSAADTISIDINF
ncbi:VWA domain-containing protein [Acidobacteriota bacterium]